MKSRLLSTDGIIQSYQTKFAELKSAFQGRAVLTTEIAVGRVENAVDRVESATRLVDITVTRVLDVASGAGGSLDRPRSGLGYPDGWCSIQPRRLT